MPVLVPAVISGFWSPVVPARRDPTLDTPALTEFAKGTQPRRPPHVPPVIPRSSGPLLAGPTRDLLLSFLLLSLWHLAALFPELAARILCASRIPDASAGHRGCWCGKGPALSLKRQCGRVLSKARKPLPPLAGHAEVLSTCLLPNRGILKTKACDPVRSALASGVGSISRQSTSQIRTSGDYRRTSTSGALLAWFASE